MHLFWLVLFVPAVILSQWVWPILRQRSIWTLSTITFGGLIVAWMAMGLPGLASNEQNVDGVLRMFAFRLVASTDLPLVQLFAACGVGWLRSKRQPVRPLSPEPELPVEQPVSG